VSNVDSEEYREEASNAGRFSVDGLVDRSCGNCGYPVGDMTVPGQLSVPASIIHIYRSRNVSLNGLSRAEGALGAVFELSTSVDKAVNSHK
jgi:hypothetical protein